MYKVDARATSRTVHPCGMWVALAVAYFYRLCGVTISACGPGSVGVLNTG